MISEKGWVAAGDLSVGNEVYLLDGSYAFVTSSDFEELDDIIQVYNLEVEDFHSYFVDENSILVHNMYPKQDLPVRDASGKVHTYTANFIDYTRYRFTRNDHIRLRQCCDEMTARRIKFMLSNSNTDFILQLYSEYNITEISARRVINCNGEGRGTVTELIIPNY